MCLQIKELTRQVPAAPGSHVRPGTGSPPPVHPGGAEPALPKVTGHDLGASLQSADLGQVPLLCLQGDTLRMRPAKAWAVTDDLNRLQWSQ